MPTLGEELRRLREERSIPLAEISEATRIGTRFLKAIENDNFSVLPGGIFTRSFIRAYAKQVGMDEDDAVARYQRQVSGGSAGDAQEARVGPEQLPPREKPTKPVPAIERKPTVAPMTRRTAPPVVRNTTAPPRNWARVIIGFVIVLFIGAVIITLIRQLNAGSARSSEQIAASRENQSSTAASQPPQAGAPALQSAPQPTAAETSRQSSQSSPLQADDPSKLVVRLEASSGDSWIKYQVDDASPMQMILKQGQVQEIPAALNQIKLNYGNRETLKLTINNREASFPADTPKFRSQVIISKDTLKSFFQ